MHYSINMSKCVLIEKGIVWLAIHPNYKGELFTVCCNSNTPFKLIGVFNLLQQTNSDIC